MDARLGVQRLSRPVLRPESGCQSIGLITLDAKHEGSGVREIRDAPFEVEGLETWRWHCRMAGLGEKP